MKIFKWLFGLAFAISSHQMSGTGIEHTFTLPDNRQATTSGPDKQVLRTDSMQELIVTGTREAESVRHLPLTVTVVDRQALTEQQQLSILPALTQYIPGLVTTSRGVMGYGVSGGGSGAINMRGISSASAESGAGQVMVLIDGHPHYQGLFGHSIADSYHTMMAERIEVIRGPASVLYGSNAMGGVINIITRSEAREGVHTTLSVGAGSYGTLQASATQQIRFGRFHSTIAGQYGRSDNHRPNMGFEQGAGMVKLGYDISEHWQVSADLNLTRFNASYPGSTDSPLMDAEQWITRGVASASVDNTYRNTSGSLSAYYTFGNHRINDGHATTAPAAKRYFRSRDAMAGLMWYQSARLFEGNRLTLGFDYQNIHGKAWNQVIATDEDLPPMVDKREHEVAAYIDFRQDIASWFTANIGVRLDHHSRAGSEWIPQVGMAFRPMDNGELKLTVSKGFRNPTIREMYLFATKNENLEAERIMNYEIAWRQRCLNNRLNYGINVFFIDGDNAIMMVPAGAGRKFMNAGNIRNHGIEADATYRVNRHWSMTTNHSYLHMKQAVLAAPSYKGALGASFHEGRWSANTHLLYVHHLYTQVGKAPKRENFCLLNAAVSYQVLKQLSIWARGENLLAQHYELNAGYPMPKATVMAGIQINF